MNEKIKLFAERAGMKPQDDMTKFGMGEDMNSYNCQGFMLEKFAELIIRECAGLAKTKSDFIVEQAMKYAEDADEEISAKATAWQFLVFEQDIKKHFGV